MVSAASADLVGLYTFDGANPLEAVIGSPAKDGVANKNSAATMSDAMVTLSTVSDAAVLGDRTGVISVPSYSTLAIPNPGLQKDWTIAFWFYVPETAKYHCFFQFGNPANSGDGSLFIRNGTDIGAGSYTEGISGIVGAWHQLVVSSSNNTQTVWFDQQKLNQTRSWNIAGMALLQFSLDNDGEDATMYFDEIRLYDETAPSEVFPNGTGDAPALLARWTESTYFDSWGSFSRTPDRVIESQADNTRIYVFSRHGSFTFAPNKQSNGAKMLLVGGGGAGGMLRGGGGGAGAVVYVENVNFAPQTYEATVGAGGIPDIHQHWTLSSSDVSKLHPGVSTAATCGGTSSVAPANSGTVVAIAPGGGGGGNFNYANNNNIPAEGYGLDGASGGGAAGKSTSPGSGISGLGHSGGDASTESDNSGGGGGGAGSSGSNGSSSTPGYGGRGVTCEITGAPVMYGGGGGGSSYNLAAGEGGEGGGGDGVASNVAGGRNTACNGVDGLGGGGGGGSGRDNAPYSSTGGRGGDGAVILRVNTVNDDDPAPTLSLAGATIGYTNATLTTRLVAFGTGASSAAVSLVVSANQDLSSPIFSDVIAADSYALNTFTNAFASLVTNTTYYARATAVNDKNVEGLSALVSFTTLNPAPAAGSATFAWCGYRSIAANATLTDFGAGSESASMWLEVSADGFETFATSSELVATAGETAIMSVSGLAPETAYQMRVRFVNEWNLVSYVPVSGVYSTRDAPLASTGIDFGFSSDKSIVDFAFGITAVYDGAGLSATLAYGGNDVGTLPASGPGTLSWPGIPAASGVATATVTVVAEMPGETCTNVWEISVTPGASARSVGSLAELRATPVRQGDTISLPELSHQLDRYQVLDMRSFEIAADGRTLVAKEPGFSAVRVYRYNPVSDTVDPDPTMGLAVCVPVPEGSGRVFIAKPQTGKWSWANAANWENLTGNEADYPHLVDDVAIAPMPKNQLVIDADVAVGAIYIGQDTSSLNDGDIRLTGKNSATLTFARSSGAPGLLRVTGLARYDAIGGFFRFRVGGGDGNKATGLGIEMPGGLDADCGDWPHIADTETRAKSGRVRIHMGNPVRYWNIPSGKTLRIFNVYGYTKLESDDQGGNANFTWENNAQVAGSGTFLYDGVASTYIDDPFYNFEGTVAVRNKQRFDGFSMGSRGGSFWMVNWTQTTQFATNATLLVEGDAAFNNGLSHSSSFGVVSYGNSHGYGSWGTTENAFPAKKWILDGGVARISGMNNASWGTPPIAVPSGAETLVVSNGFFSIQLFNSQGDDKPTNVLHFAALEHAGDGVLHVRTDRLWNSHNKSLARDFVVLEGFADFSVGGTGTASYSTTDPDAANVLDATAPIVPWIVGSINNWQNVYFPGAAADGALVLGGYPAETVLAEAEDPTLNVRVNNASIALSEDLTVNSLVLQNNVSKETRLGEDRTLTLMSGGLILGDSSRARIGTEAGVADGSNGTLHFPRKAYVYSPRQSASDPNEIWARIVAPQGAVFSYPGDLRIGGDQTGIDERIAVNGTRLQLGSSSTGCEIDVPVHLHGAFAEVKIGKAGSFCGQVLYFWDHGTPGSKFVPAAGTTETVEKCYVDGVALQRGTWGSSQSAADHVDDNHFTGTGMIEIVADEMSGPDIANPELVTRDDSSATFSFDLWPGFGADRVDVYAIATAAGSDDVLTNLIYSSVSPADGHFEGTLAGLESETSYTARLLAVNQSGGDSFATECPDEVAFTTLAAELPPLVQLGEPSAIGPGGAIFPWLLARTGSGRTIVSVRLYWAESASALNDLSTCQFVEAPAADRVPGNHATELVGLRPGSAYFALLVAENDGSADNVCTSGPVAFATASENCPGDRALEIGSCVRTPDQFTSIVSAPAGEPAFPNVYMVWGSRYGGEVVSNWDSVMRVGSMAASASFLTVEISSADLGDAVYIRFVGMADGGKSAWSESYYLPDIPVVAEVLPKVGAGSIFPDSNGVTLSAFAFNAGSLSEDGLLDISLEYALAPDAFVAGSQAKKWTVPFAEDAPTGAVAAVRIADLRSERRYYARFVAVNNRGQTGPGDVFSFATTLDEGCSVGAADWGLLQMRLSAGGGNADDLDKMVWDETKAVGVEGAIMGYCYNPTQYYSGKAGTSFAWANNTGFFYKGWMFLAAGRTYTFGSAIDDSCTIRINGVEILRQPNFSSQPCFGHYRPEASAWHEIDIRMGNGSGGAGAVGDGNTFGLGFNTTRVETVSASAMSSLIDSGDGSLLRPHPSRTLEIVSAELVQGGVSVMADISAGLPVGTLRAFWGATDCGTNATAWAQSSDLAQVDNTASTVTNTIPVVDPALTPLCRLAIIDASGAEIWTPLFSLDVSQPQIGNVSAVADGDQMSVSGALVSVGSGTGFDLSLLVGYGDDIAATQTLSVDAGTAGAFSATVSVDPGTNGWWQLVATTTDGGYDATLPAAFRTKAGSVLASAASVTAVTHHDITATGALEVLGAGATVVSLWYGEDDNPSNFVQIAEKPATEAAAVVFSATIAGAPRTLYFQLRSVNVAPGGTSWTSASDIFQGTTVDQATYTWKIEKTAGDWNDPENWTPSGVSNLADILGYPNSTKASVKFLDGTEAEIAVPTGTWYFSTMSLNLNSLDLAFVGEGAGTTTLSGNVGGGDDNSVWNGWRVVFDNLTVYETDTIRIGGPKTQNATLRLQNGAVYSMNGWQESKGTNVWVEAVGGSSLKWRNGDNDNAGFTLWVANGGLRLVNSTANPPDFNFQRGKLCGDQTVVLRGSSVFRVRRYGRTCSESEDPWTYGDLNLSFNIPFEDWCEPGSAPMYADYARNNSDNRMFAWRSSATGKKVVLSVDSHSPLLRSGRVRTVWLLGWFAGIDTKNVEFEEREGVDMFYTYGWPSTRTEPNSEDEIPTGVAARVTGIGATVIRVR